MRISGIRCLYIFLAFMLALCSGCANITAPTGGKKDITPPKLIEIDPRDSLLNTKVKRIDLDFDEYITVNDVTKEVELSPMLAIQPTVTGRNKHVTIKIVDSLLEDNTTYRLSLGHAIKDLHEGNAFSGYTYTFSTGAYFDSLQLSGTVINAATGLPDSSGISIVLYSAKDNDSAVVRHKPKYVTKANARGEFTFKGLPPRSFRIYALKDINSNLIYDGPQAGEQIAFNDAPVFPYVPAVAAKGAMAGKDSVKAGLPAAVKQDVPVTASAKEADDSTRRPIALRMFTEVMPDTSTRKNTDSLKKTDSLVQQNINRNKNKQGANKTADYSVNLDTTNATHRTFDITRPVYLTFTQPVQLNKDKITLTCDSAGVTLTPPITITPDSLRPLIMHISPGSPNEMTWAEDRVYTLRLAKGFAKDTGGKDLMPSRYTFHTKEDDDYGKIKLHLPAKYRSIWKANPDYLLLVTTDQDTVYYKRIEMDTIITLTRLKPAKYTFRIIVDKNHNGKWDTGDLFGKIQPEEMIPYPEKLNLRTGWENDIDFEQKPPEKKTTTNDNIKPK